VRSLVKHALALTEPELIDEYESRGAAHPCGPWADVVREGRVAWVRGIVVFTNPDLTLDLHSPTVPVIRVQDLPRAILDTRSPVPIPAPALTKIGLALLGMKNA